MISVAIFGLGRVGAGFGLSPKAPQYSELTHLGAISARNDLFRVAHLADKSGRRLALASEKIGLGNSVKLEAVEQVDLCVIATSTNQHLESCIEALSFSPRLLLMEKPATGSLRELEEVIRLCAESKTALWIAYNRRWDEKHRESLERLTGDGSKVLAIRALTSGDLESNASHVLEMALQFAPDLSIEKIENRPDWGLRLSLFDSKLGVALDIHHFANYPARLFEVEVLTDTGIVNLFASGSELMLRQGYPSDWLDGQEVLGPCAPVSGGIRSTFSNMYQNVVSTLNSGEIVDNLGAAVATRKLLDRILHSLGPQ